MSGECLAIFTEPAAMSVGSTAKPTVTPARPVDYVTMSVVNVARSANCAANSTSAVAKPISGSAMSIPGLQNAFSMLQCRP